MSEIRNFCIFDYQIRPTKVVAVVVVATLHHGRRELKCNHIMNPHTVFSPLLRNMLFSAYFYVLFKPNPLSKVCGFMIWLHFSASAGNPLKIQVVSLKCSHK